MASREYSNFDLLIEPDGDHYRVRVLQSAAGVGSSADFKLTLKDSPLEILSLKVGRARRGAWRGVHAADNEELAAAKRFGEILFNAIFQENIVACLNTSLQAARAQNQGLRVLLRLPADLAQLPWEYLYNSNTNQFLAVSTHTPLVRYFELPQNNAPLEVTLPLRLLVAISSPENYRNLDVEREWRALQDALQPLVARGAVLIDRLEHVSPLDLQAQLRRAQYHVFHFIGHSAFAPGKQNGVLIFNDEHRQGKAIDGQKLGALLADHDSLRLVVLNSCEGARTGIDDPFAGLAQSLVQMGLPAVIAMQYEISDEAAILFAREFYRALADGYGVDAALGDARKAIFTNHDSIEWGTPVLFTRALDTQIFNLAPPARPSDDFGSLVERAPLPPERLAKSGATPTPQDANLTRLYEDGLSAFHLENWPRACECFQSVLQLRPDYRDAAEKLAQARQQIDLAQRYQQAQDLLDRSDWLGALVILEKLTSESPAYRDASHHLQHARQQAHLQALYTDAARQSQAGEWQAVIDSFAQIAKLQPDYPDPQNLLPQARQQLAAQQRAQKLAELYTNALHAMNNRRWSDAQRLLIPLVKMEPQYRDAPQLLEKARSEIARQRSSQGGARLLAWLSARRRGLAVAGLVLIGLGGLIFALMNLPAIMAPAIMPSVTHSITPSLTSELALSPSPIHTLTLTPSLTATLTPIGTPTVTLTVTATPPPGMIFIPAGPFQMGSNQGSDNEKPIHTVTINAFWIDKYEVTNADYAKCVTDGKCNAPTSPRQGYYGDSRYANYPMINVSWDEVDAYCKNVRNGGRLPTEAEWEKAARGGLEGKLYPWGDTFPVCTAGAENGAQFWGCPVQDTVAVGSFKANGYGLFDMAGNAWEWVSDWYNSSYYGSSPASNPPGPEAAGNQYKVLRGGGWSYVIDLLRVAGRLSLLPATRNLSIGFRCAATPGN